MTGRKSGRSISLPVWFVHEGDKLLLLPLRGKSTNWYKNILKTPTVGISATGTRMTGKARRITDPTRVKEVVEKFWVKYSAEEVKKYYSKFDACVEVVLT